MLLSRIAILSLILTIFSIACAGEPGPIPAAVQNEIAKRFSGARIELTDDIHWTSSVPTGAIESIRVGEDNARAQVGITVETRDEEGIHRGYGYATFAAWTPARVAVRRVLPGEKLQNEQFAIREINVATGVNRELRGVILDQKVKISDLQARQTVLEGQALLSSAVERVPDVRQGDPVSLHVISNGLTLSAQAVAAEPGYMNGLLKVLTERGKREFSGKLVSHGIVEVRL